MSEYEDIYAGMFAHLADPVVRGLLEDEYACETQLGDMDAEFRSECAQFGDAGPGAQITLGNMRRALSDIRAELVRAGYAPCPMPFPAIDWTDEVPF